MLGEPNLASEMLRILVMKRKLTKLSVSRLSRRRAAIRRLGCRTRPRFARAAAPGGTRGVRQWRRGSTLLALVQDLQRRTRSDAEVVRRVRSLVNTGAVVLTGNFAGQRF